MGFFFLLSYVNFYVIGILLLKKTCLDISILINIFIIYFDKLYLYYLDLKTNLKIKIFINDIMLILLNIIVQKSSIVMNGSIVYVMHLIYYLFVFKIYLTCATDSFLRVWKM